MAARDAIMKKPKDARSALRRTLSYLGGFRLALLGVLLLCFVSNVLALLGPSLAGSAINEAAAGKGAVNMAKVKLYARRMLLCYLASSLINLAISVAMQFISRGIARKLREDVFGKLMRLPVGYFDRHQAGDIISRVSYDVDVIATCIATDVTQILTSVVTVVGSLVMMLVISLPLSVVVLITIPVSVLYTVTMRKKTQPRYRRRSECYGAMNGFVEELFSGQKTVQAYAYEETACRRFEAVNTATAEAYREAEYYGCTMGPTAGAISYGSMALIGVLGCLSYMAGGVTLGQISSFVLYSRKFSGPINEIANVINEIFSALSAAERVFALLDEPEEVEDRENAVTLREVTGSVAMDHVSFGYLKERTILHDLNLESKPGELVAIVGPTGAGKTTIINLLMRFYDVGSGAVRGEGRDIRDYTRSSLRGAYAMVLQDTWVFRGTIFENIAYGKEDATMEEVVRAAKAARIHSFIMRLPEGYHTVISEDGGNISKGQKQLLTIARAMLYDTSMLILDEATSNVDTGTERQVQKAMRTLMQGKTCFVIAHRLSTVRNADHILVLDHGDVVETGTHETLMAAGGFYRKLYDAQFE